MLPGKTLLLWGSIIGVLFVLASISTYYSQYLTTQVAVPEQPADQPVSANKDQPAAVDPNRILVRFDNNNANTARAIFDQYYSKGAVRGETTTAAPSPSSDPPASPTPSPSNTAASTDTPSPSPTDLTVNTTDTPTPSPSATASPTPPPVQEQKYTVTDRAAIADLAAAVPALAEAKDQITAFAPVFRAPATTADSSAINRWYVLTVGDPSSAPIPVSNEYAHGYTTDPAAIFDPAHSYSENERVTLTKLADIIETLAQTSAFEAVELNHVVYTQMIPNDPYYHSTGSWGQSYDDLWGMKKIEAASAWDITQGEGVTVAVIDTGIDYNHEDIDDNIWTNLGETGLDSQGNDKRSNNLDDDGNGYIDDWRGWDFANNDNDPMDGHGHGTHVAGTIAAEGNNNLGVIGVAPKAKVMAVKGLSDGGYGYENQLAEAVIYSADINARVTNSSWGGYGTSQILEDAFTYADFKDTINIAAAGNNRSNVTNYTPANINTVFSVGSTEHYDRESWFSNWGDALDVGAPGEDILSLRAAGSTYDKSHLVPPGDNNAKYVRLDGTSMSSPHVAGLAALVVKKFPNMSNEDIYQLIRTSADDIGLEKDKDISVGWGRINAGRALNNFPKYPYVRLDIPPHELLINPNNGPYEIRGSATGNNFTHYTVEMGIGKNPATWTTDNITLTGNGSQQVIHNILATWQPDTQSPQIITFRVIAYTPEGNNMSNYSSPITVDPSVRQGWPVDKDPSEIWMDKDYLNTGIGDIDPDEQKEIILRTPCGINVYNHDGSSVEGWPVESSDSSCTFSSNNPLLLSDVDSDGKDEIVISTTPWAGRLNPQHARNSLYVLDGDGSIMPGWPVTYAKDYSVGDNYTEHSVGQMAVADINGDEKPEIIMITYNAHSKRADLGTPPETINIKAWDEAGAMLASFPKHIELNLPKRQYNYADKESAINVVDINSDRQPEFFFLLRALPGETKSLLVGLNNDGTPLPGWPVEVQGITQGNLSLGNIVGDAKPEIVVFTYQSIAVYDLDGQPVAPWPKPLDNHDITEQLISGASPTLVDIDDDGYQEITFGQNAYNRNGQRIASWKPRSPGCLTTIDSGSALTDIDGDGARETITDPNYTQYCYTPYTFIRESALFAVSHDGTHPPSWPKYLPWNGYGVHVVADDLDGDNTIEVVKVIYDAYFNKYKPKWENVGKLIVYNTPGLASAGTWPMVHKDAQHSRGYNQVETVTPQCSNQIDDPDAEDTLIDESDPGCYDNGNTVTGTYSPLDDDETHLPACGNGVIDQPAEQCDDGNTVNGDKCSSICQIEPNQADLALQLVSYYPNPLALGKPVGFYHRIYNDGPDPATHLTFTANIPAGLTFLPQGSLAGCAAQDNQVNNQVICPSPPLNQTFPITFTVSPSHPACPSPGYLTAYTAQVSADENDPRPSNNTSSVSPPIACPSPSPSPLGHTAFVTSKVFNGALGGLAGADAKCQASAAAGGLTGSWKAILSDSYTSARNRLTITGPIYDTVGHRIAANSTDLWDGSLQSPIAYNEYKTKEPKLGGNTSVVWTGTFPSGNSSGTRRNCINWNSTLGTATHGYLTANNFYWIYNSDFTCNTPARLYCISQ